MSFYLRQGPWCPCERSCNTASGTLELGVSAYECDFLSPGSFKGKGKAFQKRERAFSGQQRKHLGSGSPFYVVTGNVVGTGADGEPLLKKVVAHVRVVWDEVGQFNTTGKVTKRPHAPHPGYPNCRCLTVDELDEHERREQKEEWRRMAEDAADEEPLDIEFLASDRWLVWLCPKRAQTHRIVSG